MNEQNNNTVEGFNEKQVQDVTYFQVFDFSLCQKSKTPREKSDGTAWEGPIKTTNPRDGSEVQTYVNRFDSIVARIVDVNKYESNFNNGNKEVGLAITLMAGNRKGIWKIAWLKGELKRFLKVSPNINFEKPVRISVFKGRKDDGSPKLAVSFKQGDGPNPENWEKVNEYWNARNLPQPFKDDMTNKYDYSEQNKVLGQNFFAEVLPRIKDVANRLGIKPPAEPQEAHPDEVVDDEDERAAMQEQVPVAQVADTTQVLANNHQIPAEMVAPQPSSGLAQARANFQAGLQGQASPPVAPAFVPPTIPASTQPTVASPFAPKETVPFNPNTPSGPSNENVPF